MLSKRLLKEYVLSLLFPRRCPVCHDVVKLGYGLICPACRDKVRFVQEPTCLRCGKEIAAKEVEYCYDCSRQLRSYTCGFALCVYDDTMRESIRRFKNRGRKEYADWYTDEIWKRYGERIRSLQADCLVPVPLHSRRQRERGYNQAEVLARILGKRYCYLPVLPQALVRTHSTTAQKYLGAGERRRNLEQVFVAGAQSVAGKKVILMDDIYTTGQTAEECTKVLLEAGATAVYLVNVCIGENDT